MAMMRAIAVLAGLAAMTADAAAQITVNTEVPGIAADGSCSIVEAVDNANFHGTVHTDCAPGAQLVTKENLEDPKVKEVMQPDLKKWLNE